MQDVPPLRTERCVLQSCARKVARVQVSTTLLVELLKAGGDKMVSLALFSFSRHFRARVHPSCNGSHPTLRCVRKLWKGNVRNALCLSVVRTSRSIQVSNVIPMRCLLEVVKTRAEEHFAKFLPHTRVRAEDMSDVDATFASCTLPVSFNAVILQQVMRLQCVPCFSRTLKKLTT